MSVKDELQTGDLLVPEVLASDEDNETRKGRGFSCPPPNASQKGMDGAEAVEHAQSKVAGATGDSAASASIGGQDGVALMEVHT